MLGAGSPALITVAAVLSLQNMPNVAESGWSSIAYDVLGALFFLVPPALEEAALATGWPKRGGIYAWVKEAFGDQTGIPGGVVRLGAGPLRVPDSALVRRGRRRVRHRPGPGERQDLSLVTMLVIVWGLTFVNFALVPSINISYSTLSALTTRSS